MARCPKMMITTPDPFNPLEEIAHQVMSCEQCPRLRAHCRAIAQVKRRSFRGDEYWEKPVPGWGDPQAKLFLLGLAPAAHGANRTGRVFTGDRSGEWLYRALFESGFSNQPESHSVNDGLTLFNAYISCIVKCAPPQNKPTPEEIKTCSGFLQSELSAMQSVQVYIALGQMAYQALWSMLKGKEKKPPFEHGLSIKLNEKQLLILSYHPSQQNTFTGKLTWPMFELVFQMAQNHLKHATHLTQR